MASFETLLISVRSETPTSFFLVLSKTAFFANCALGCPAPPAASFLRPARLETAFCESGQYGSMRSWWQYAGSRTIADAQL
jgi:hypothetical protein